MLPPFVFNRSRRPASFYATDTLASSRIVLRRNRMAGAGQQPIIL